MPLLAYPRIASRQAHREVAHLFRSHALSHSPSGVFSLMHTAGAIRGAGSPFGPPMHTLIDGPTGAGKGELILQLYFGDWIARPDSPGIVFLDPRGKTAEKAAQVCMKHGLLQSGQALFDRLRNPYAGIGYAFIDPSKHPDPRIRRAENRARINTRKTMLVHAEGELDMAKSVMLDEVGDDTFSLGFHRTEPIPLPWLLDAFSLKPKPHKTGLYLRSTCTDEWTRRKWDEYEMLSFIEQQYKLTPIRRRLEKFVNCIQIAARSLATVDHVGFLNRGGKLLVSGESKGEFDSTDSIRNMEMILLNIFDAAYSGQFTRKVIVIIDEASNFRLQHVVKGLAQLRQKNCEIAFSTQNTKVFTPEIQTEILQETRRKFIFQQNDPDASYLFAKIFGITLMDLNSVKHIDYTTRMVDDGWDEIPTRSKSTSGSAFDKHVTETIGTRLIPRRKEVQEAHERHFTGEEVILLGQKELMTMGPGQYKAISDSYCSTKPEYFPMMPMPYEGDFYPGDPPIPLGQKELDDLMEELYRTRPEYKLIDYPKEPEWTPPQLNGTNGKTSAMERNAMPKPSNGSANGSPNPRANSSRRGSSAPRRKPGNGSTSSGNGKK